MSHEREIVMDFQKHFQSFCSLNIEIISLKNLHTTHQIKIRLKSRFYFVSTYRGHQDILG